MSTLPPIDRATLPADIRSASTQVQQQYQAGLLFEKQLTTELAKQLTSTAGSSLTDSPYASLLPDALADSITQAGGLGIARTLVDLPETST
jgi:Rod binding domain-containing protein